jgi:hypothetical protein
VTKSRTSLAGALVLAGAGRQIAKSRDWKGTDAEVRKERGDRIVVMMTGERKGQDRDRRCVYNTKTNKAQFED